MSLQKDKVTDVIAVLEIMKNEFKGASRYRNTTEIRKDAVKEFAEREAKAGRFKNIQSANNTIHDACARRLKPDIGNIEEFDRFADEWRQRASTNLKDALIGHSNSSTQRILVSRFFD